MNRVDRRGFLKAGLAGLLAAGGARWASGQQGLSQERYKELLSRGLEEVLERIPLAARRRTAFTLNLFIAHEAWIEGMPEEVLLKAIDAFADAGVDHVDMNPGQFPWVDRHQPTIAKYDAAATRIREHGLKLGLNPQYSTIKHQVASFDQWRTRAISIYAELARRYRPHTFVVVHEPSTMAARMRRRVSISRWVVFARQAAAVVRESSPGSRIAAGGLASERRYFEAFARMPEVDALTLDIYGIKDLRTYNKMIRFARARGKPVYIEETWRPPYFEAEPGMTPDSASLKNVGNRAFQCLDEQWLRVMTTYAQANHLEAITPVWMWPLFKYVDGNGDLDDPAYNRAAVQAILNGERTALFHTLKQLVLANRALRS